MSMYNSDLLIDAEWQTKPFRHVVIQDMWDDDFLEQCAAEFPPYDDHRWIEFDNPDEHGKKAGPESMWGETTKAFFREVRGMEFTAAMEMSSKIDPLTADDVGGGMHVTAEGGRLEMHVDFNVHPHQPLERRLNMLVFLNHRWQKKWGGVLYLGKDKDVEIMPTFNKTILFECSDSSYHGHPDPIVGVAQRKSLACYFYAPLRDGVLENAHSTVWERS